MDWDVPSPFLLSVCPQAADIDGLNHTNNAVYVQWCERIAWAHSEALGLSLADYRSLDRAMAIQRATYDYLLPTLLGEPLRLATWLGAADGRLSMQRHFQLRRERDGVCVMRGQWNLVCIELSSGRARRMPAEFMVRYLPAIQQRTA
ncbi:acyl-CoA thioesterase [Roseateles koreensis]|uniref:Thioesterase family protein n=1 Tax=Roseateles koreensis TaxID=2987526 RepID=A0ABT5KQF2_9BURK|nr:thioesterase family protein [Roseateles koreensis]MDC8784685.1 thioesterase family protein [Roseateles koreensis]